MAREVMSVLWAVKKYRAYLWDQTCTLITGCSALTWIFKSQSLSSEIHHWALRLMEFDVRLQWHVGTPYQTPDALPCLSRFREPGGISMMRSPLRVHQGSIKREGGIGGGCCMPQAKGVVIPQEGHGGVANVVIRGAHCFPHAGAHYGR